MTDGALLQNQLIMTLATQETNVKNRSTQTTTITATIEMLTPASAAAVGVMEAVVAAAGAHQKWWTTMVTRAIARQAMHAVAMVTETKVAILTLTEYAREPVLMVTILVVQEMQLIILETVGEALMICVQRAQQLTTEIIATQVLLQDFRMWEDAQERLVVLPIM